MANTYSQCGNSMIDKDLSKEGGGGEEWEWERGQFMFVVYSNQNKLDKFQWYFTRLHQHLLHTDHTVIIYLDWKTRIKLTFMAEKTLKATKRTKRIITKAQSSISHPIHITIPPIPYCPQGHCLVKLLARYIPLLACTARSSPATNTSMKIIHRKSSLQNHLTK